MSPSSKSSLQINKYFKVRQNAISKKKKLKDTSKSFPNPSSNGVQRCGICGKTEKELVAMMVEVYGDDWKDKVKKMCKNNIRPGVKDIQANKSCIKVSDYFENDNLKVTEEIQDSTKKGTNNISIFNTLPNQLELTLTKDKEIAVISKQKIESLTKFGPYIGVTGSKIPKDSYSFWQFETVDGKVKTYINGDSCVKSNWMSRVKKNRNTANCVAWVYNDKVFYKSIRTILPGEELIVHPDLFEDNNGEYASNDDTSNEIFKILPKRAIRKLRELNITRADIVPSDWFNHFSSSLEEYVKNAFEGEESGVYYSVNNVELSQQDLLSVRKGCLTDNLVKYYVHCKKLNFGEGCYVLTDLDEAYGTEIGDAVNYVIGCCRVNGESWISVFAMRDSDFIYVCTEYAEDVDHTKINSLLVSFFESARWGSRQVKEMKLKKSGKLKHRVLDKQLNSAVAAVHFIDQIAEQLMSQGGTLKFKLKSLVMSDRHLEFGVIRWFIARYIRGSGEYHRGLDPNGGRYESTDKTIELVKSEQISKGYKGIFTDVQNRILSYNGLDKIMKGSNSDAEKLSNWFETYREHLSPDVERILRRKWNFNIRFTVKLAASGQTLEPAVLLDLHNEKWLDLNLLKYYTHRQIEKFGLEGRVCYFAMDNTELVRNYNSKKMLTAETIASPDKKIRKHDYCLCCFNLGGAHFVSLFASKTEGKLYITDPQSVYHLHIQTEEYLLKIFFDAWKVKLRVVRDTKRNFQKDGFNCGVYSAEYNEQILNAVKLSVDGPGAFRMPEELSVDANLMAAGVYRWRMAEFMLHENAGLPLSNYCYLTNLFVLGYSRSNVKELEFDNGEEIVVCTTCTRAYRKSEREKFIDEHNLKKNTNKIQKIEELQFVKNYVNGDYCVFCRSSENLETRKHVKTTDHQVGRQVREIPKNVEPESPRLLTAKRDSKKKSTKITDEKTSSENNQQKDSSSSELSSESSKKSSSLTSLSSSSENSALSRGQKRDGTVPLISSKMQKVSKEYSQSLKNTSEIEILSSDALRRKSAKGKSCKKRLFGEDKK